MKLILVCGLTNKPEMGYNVLRPCKGSGHACLWVFCGEYTDKACFFDPFCASLKGMSLGLHKCILTLFVRKVNNFVKFSSWLD